MQVALHSLHVADAPNLADDVLDLLLRPQLAAELNHTLDDGEIHLVAAQLRIAEELGLNPVFERRVIRIRVVALDRHRFPYESLRLIRHRVSCASGSGCAATGPLERPISGDVPPPG